VASGYVPVTIRRLGQVTAADVEAHPAQYGISCADSDEVSGLGVELRPRESDSSRDGRVPAVHRLLPSLHATQPWQGWRIRR
jgi:hypothetical protein